MCDPFQRAAMVEVNTNAMAMMFHRLGVMNDLSDVRCMVFPYSYDKARVRPNAEPGFILKKR